MNHETALNTPSMSKYKEYAKHINANEFVLRWVDTTLKNHLEKHNPPTEEVEHILDYLAQSNKKLERMSYTQALKLTTAWDKAQQKKGADIEEKPEDVEVVLDFKDGFKFVKLIGENAYKREGFLMRHCVASYYGKKVEVYSLRDKDNVPHCTIEKDQQIKGRGNGDIHPKYIDYVVKFLEHTGMTVGDSEMKHLGYVNIESILDDCHKDVKKHLYAGKYLPKDKRSIIKDKDGKEMCHVGMLGMFPLIEEVGESIKVVWDIPLLVSGSIEWIKKMSKTKKVVGEEGGGEIKAAGNYSHLTAGYGSHLAAGYGSRLAAGYGSHLAAGDDSHLAAGDCSRLAAGHDSHLAAGYDSRLAAGDDSHLAAGDYSRLAAGNDSHLAAGNYSRLAASNDSRLAAGNHSHLAAGYDSRLAAGDDSHLAAGNRSRLAAGYDSHLTAGNRSHLVAGNRSRLAAGNHSRLAAGDCSRLAAGYDSRLAAGNHSHLAAGYDSRLAAGDDSHLAAGDYSRLAAGNDSHLAAGNYSHLAAGYDSRLAAGNYSHLALDGADILAISGRGSKIKGKKGSGFALGVYDDYHRLTDVLAVFIDGEKYKEDTYYWVKDGKIVEYKEE